MFSFSKLNTADWIFIVIFDIAVFYIGWNIGKSHSN